MPLLSLVITERFTLNNPYRTASHEQRSRDAYVCTCCQRPWDICVTVASRPDSERRQRTCPECHSHASSTMAANREHIEMWRSFVSAQQSDHDAQVKLLRQQISELEKALSERPEKIVERYIGQEELDDAKAEAERAFRSRENAWQALCEIRLIHREGESGHCRCGSAWITARSQRS